jgi:hypothetical protein
MPLEREEARRRQAERLTEETGEGLIVERADGRRERVGAGGKLEKLMSREDVLELLRDFPEAPAWITERSWTLKDARNAMIKRRLLMPATAPMTRDRALANALFRKLKGDTR